VGWRLINENVGASRKLGEKIRRASAAKKYQKAAAASSIIAKSMAQPLCGENSSSIAFFGVKIEAKENSKAKEICENNEKLAKIYEERNNHLAKESENNAAGVMAKRKLSAAASYQRESLNGVCWRSVIESSWRQYRLSLANE
jgi:glycerate kinase